MNSNTPSPPNEDELHALVDGRLDATQRVELETRIATDPHAQATVAQWTRQRAWLKTLHTELLDESPPPHLHQAAQQAGTRQQLAHRLGRWGGVAASVLLSFALGWLAHGVVPASEQFALTSQRQPGTDFIRQASVAHAVYTPEVRHPVEVTKADQAHLVQWLSKRLGRSLKVPDLTGQGFDLVGGRLLPAEAGVRAQFMFQNAGGTRLTLYLGAVHGDAQGGNTQESAFRFTAEGAVSSFYWVEQGFGYALTGPLPREALMQLAQAVYQQL